MKPTLYIIAGCNGAGKTTASYSVLPDWLTKRQFLIRFYFPKLRNHVRTRKKRFKRNDKFFLEAQKILLNFVLTKSVYKHKKYQ